MNANFTYKLSVIIVNYNVEYFVDQCLDAVKKAIKNQPIEIIVMDNASLDGSVEVLKTKHSDCTLVFNETNVGFSMANNQGIKRAKGEYILLLNPDTIVEESTFEKVIAFMDAHPNVGGLGVRMIDGRGKFLPESKRGLPTPKVAFYKIFGLSKLFPKSKRFGKFGSSMRGGFGKFGKNKSADDISSKASEDDREKMKHEIGKYQQKQRCCRILLPNLRWQ